MRKIARVKLMVMAAILFLSLVFASFNFSTAIFTQEITSIIPLNNRDSTINTSNSEDNYQIIQGMLSTKLQYYSDHGYFSQVYRPSLRATYYALSILDVIGKLDEIDKSSVINYIMANYNDNEHKFMDIYAKRYLDTNYTSAYYSLSSVLEVNCYAILSLDILGQLDQIDKQETVDFIWSCFNPEGNENGFIGQPYDTNLEDIFRIATIDNTFYAISTLNALMNDWSAHNVEKMKIIQYINNLQSLNYPYGFNNDINKDFRSVDLNEPNLLSSYYCIKTLHLFDMVNTIRINDFFQYLNCLYHEDGHYFDMNQNPLIPNSTNIRATALGLELMDLTGYSDIYRDNPIDFILNQKTSQGGWFTSTRNKNYELWDTFQVLLSLSNCNELNRLTNEDENIISNFLTNFYQYNGGYSLISNDYTSVDLIHTIISTFDLFDRIPDLDILGIYNQLLTTYRDYVNDVGFHSVIPVDSDFGYLYSYPIEYYCIGTKVNSLIFNMPITHKSTFKVLTSLLKIFKLDDFAHLHDLNAFIPTILNSQILNITSEGYGSFLPFYWFHPNVHKYLLYFDYTYYAIKSLELLSNYLKLGNLTDLPFNKIALRDYIEKNKVETNSTTFFNPQFTQDTEITLKYTYYMIYLLKALKSYNLNNQKIYNFVLQNLNYSNIKNIYFSYKISEILSLDINFNYSLTQGLIDKLYSNEIHEFYTGTNFEDIDQEVLLWVSEMAVNSKIDINCNFLDSIVLGDVNPIAISFHNLIFSNFGTDISVKFESDIENLEFEHQPDNIYRYDFFIPENPDYFPSVEGVIKLYKQSRCIGQYPLNFETKINHLINSSISRNKKNFLLEVNISRQLISGIHSLSSSKMTVDIFRNNLFIEELPLNRNDYPTYSRFFISYPYNTSGDYLFYFSIFDDYYPDGFIVISTNLTIARPNSPLIISGPILAGIASIFSILISIGSLKLGDILKKRIQQNGQREKKTKQKNTPKDKSAHEINEYMEDIAFKKW